jgi:GT2 family glycosyltransferase
MVILTVSVVNHNSTEPLRKCLESVLYDVQGISSEVYVVDNLCEDRAAGMLAKGFPSVRVLQNSKVLGFSANHNQVLKRAQGRYILVLNPDTLLPPGAIEYMIAFMEKHPSVAVCGPRLVDLEGNWTPPPKRVIDLARDVLLLSLYISNAQPDFVGRLQSFRRRIAGFFQCQKGSVARVDSDSDLEKELQPHPCEVISGACMFFRASAIQDVGMFDERFFLYKEELDWCLRARKHKWEIYFLPEVSVLHIGGHSTRPQYLKYLGIFVQSYLAFYEKHRGTVAKNLLRVTLTLVTVLNLLRWSVMCILDPTRQRELDPWRRFMVALLKQIGQAG